MRVYRGADCGSDHHLLLAKLNFPRLQERNVGKNGKKEEQPDLEDVDDPLYNLRASYTKVQNNYMNID